MIRQTKLIIHNGCQHRDVSVDIHPGMTAVVGPNACGKTNLLQLNAYGLTGIVDRSWGSQQSFNRHGTKDGFVEVVVNNDDINIIVRRYFTTGAKNQDRLWVHDTDHEPDIVGREKVNQYLENIYGCPMNTLSDILWVKQGQMTWLLTASSTSIYNFFNSVFDTTKIRKLKDVLMAAAQSIAVYAVDAGERQRLESEILSAQNELSTLSPEDVDDRLHDAVDKLRDLNTKTGNMITQEQKDQQILAIRTNLNQMEDRLSSTKAQIDSLSSDPASWLKDEHISFAEKYKAVREKLPMMNAEIQGTEVNVSQLKEQLNDVSRQLDIMFRNEDKASTEAERGVCPICGEHINNVSMFKENFVSIVLKSDADLKLNFENAQKDLENKLLMATQAVTTMKEKRDRYDEYVKQHIKTHQRINDAIEARHGWEAGRAALPSLIEYVNQLSSSIKTETKTLQEVIGTPVASSKVSDKVRQIQAQIASLQAEYRRQTERVGVCKATKQKAEERLKQLTAVEVANANANKWYSTLITAREGCQNSHIPARFLQDKVEVMNQEIEGLCIVSGIGFTFWLDPSDRRLYTLHNYNSGVQAGPLAA